MDNTAMIYAQAPNREPGQGRPMQFSLRTLLVGVTVFCIVAGLLAGYLYRGVSRALDAEMTLHSYTSTIEALTRFVESTGKWPKSWEELIAADRGQSRGWLTLERLADLQSRVKVRFDLDLKDIAAMTPETFSAVEQREPNYGTYDWQIAALIDAARKQQAARKGH
jgi:hypothetical protein